MGLVEAIGLVSGLASGLIKGMPVAIDAFKLVKLPWWSLRQLLPAPLGKRTIVSNLRWASKAFILVAFLGGLVNLAAEVTSAMTCAMESGPTSSSMKTQLP